MEVTIVDYARKYGLDPDNVRHRCQRGAYKTARKLGRDWVIDEDEQHVDHRVRSGKYAKMKKTD